MPGRLLELGHVVLACRSRPVVAETIRKINRALAVEPRGHGGAFGRLLKPCRYFPSALRQGRRRQLLDRNPALARGFQGPSERTRGGGAPDRPADERPRGTLQADPRGRQPPTSAGRAHHRAQRLSRADSRRFTFSWRRHSPNKILVAAWTLYEGITPKVGIRTSASREESRDAGIP